MSRKLTEDEVISLLRGIDEMPPPREEKCRTLYRLGRESFGGHVVELGGGVGHGAIALSHGMRAGGYSDLVYVVDRYDPSRPGWSGLRYGSKEEAAFWDNLKYAGVHAELWKDDVLNAAKNWGDPTGRGVSVIHWDIGIPDRMAGDFFAWERHLVRGGMYAVHDTYDRRLGANALIPQVFDTMRYRRPLEMGGGELVFVKRPTFVFCAGMSRSGGTVQYQMAAELVERAKRGRGVGFGINALDMTFNDWELVVMKTEEPKDYLIEMAEAGKADVIGTFRDPRDVAASLMEWRSAKYTWENGFPVSAMWSDILQETERAVRWQEAWASIPNAHMAQYEYMDWGLEAMRIVLHLGLGDMSARHADEVADKYNVDANRERMAELDEDWISPHTLLTKAHIGKNGGAVGRWVSDLTRPQVRQVEDVAGEWMDEHGYHRADEVVEVR
jgi:hypothetical protein